MSRVPVFILRSRILCHLKVAADIGILGFCLFTTTQPGLEGSRLN
jgi:hypothetical protein